MKTSKCEQLSQEEQRIRDDAIKFARKHKKVIASKWTDTERHPPESEPVSVFMAGSPGAGKTEASIELIELLRENGVDILRIDPDELRSEFPAYQGGNSWLFQPAVSILVERIHDLALKQCQSFLLDGTLSSYEVARKNIDRSLNRGRTVQIIYVYQDPELAWEFVVAREADEGRNIRPEHFVEQYFSAREVVNQLKLELGRKLHVDLLVKNIDGGHSLYKAGVDKIDNYVPEKYDRGALEDLLGLR